MGSQRKSYILLLDRDQAALDELRELLADVAASWRLHPVTSASAALGVLASAPVDVLVCDLQLPGTDMPELLRTVRDRHPMAMRVALTSSWDLELGQRCRGLAHQLLVRPLDPVELRAAIVRGCGIRDAFENRALLDVLARMPALPALPPVCHELEEEVASPAASVESVGRVIEKDRAIAGRVLQLASSAYFRVRRRISRPADAVSLLGFDAVEALCLMAHLFSHFEQARRSGLGVESLREHCLAVGAAGRRIARLEGLGAAAADQCFVAGILHDAGKLALACAFPDAYRRARELAHEQAQADHVSERQLFGAGHPEVGGYLMSQWRQPAPVIEAIAFHHRPADSQGLAFGPLAALHVADALEHERAGDELELLDEGYLFALGLRERLAEWREAIVPEA
jgi:HD-like signal output (HDOD) protein/CheY-like chemotaxis protein